MIALASDLLGFSQSALWAAYIVFLRVGGMMFMLPAFGEQSVPPRIKLVLTMAFTSVVVPAVAFTIPTEAAGIGWLRFTVTESISGLVLGIGLRIFVFTLQTAGSMAAQATSLAQLFGSAGVEPLPAIGHVLVISGLTLAVMAGLHIRAAELLIYSYTIMPVGGILDAADVSQWGVLRVSKAFSLAFTLAAPFVIVSMLYNLTLGVINRAMPQLMVAFVGAPVITAGGLVMMFLVAPLLLSVWLDELVSFIANPFGAVE